MPGGVFSPNGYGLFDMAGSAWEWVNDLYSETYYASSRGLTNPQGPTSGAYRVLRGGSWLEGETSLRVAGRFRDWQERSQSNYGFRCVRDAVP